MWGTHDRRPFEKNFHRFIPTHVGNTVLLTDDSHPHAVHPHACGEHLLHQDLGSHECGSSPRMWGTPRPGGRNLASSRFIPTHVGNTPEGSTYEDQIAVHPHACGEHESDAGRFKGDAGSSPRMWGTHFLQLSDDIKFSKNLEVYRNISALK